MKNELMKKCSTLLIICCLVAQACLTLCNPMDYSTPGFPVQTISWSLLKLMSIKQMMQSNHLILCHPLLLLPSIFPSIRVFSNESAVHIRWPKYWSFSINPSNEYSGLIGCSWVVGLWLFCLFTFQYFPISSNEHALL